MTSQGLLREARAVVFSLVCLGVSLALHSWAKGALPPVTAILAAAGLVWVNGLVLAGRQRGFPLIAVVLLGDQAGLHELFSLMPAAHGHAMPMAPAPPGWVMLLAHAAAATITAGWLYGGEVAVWRLVRWFALQLPSLSDLLGALSRLVQPPALVSRRDRQVERRLRLPVPVFWRADPRRGPPGLSAAR